MKVKRCPKDCQFDWARFHSDLDAAVAHLINEMESLPSETTLMSFLKYSNQKQLLQGKGK